MLGRPTAGVSDPVPKLVDRLYLEHQAGPRVRALVVPSLEFDEGRKGLPDPPVAAAG
jgi:hypothetical protein